MKVQLALAAASTFPLITAQWSSWGSTVVKPTVPPPRINAPDSHDGHDHSSGSHEVVKPTAAPWSPWGRVNAPTPKPGDFSNWSSWGMAAPMVVPTVPPKAHNDDDDGHDHGSHDNHDGHDHGVSASWDSWGNTKVTPTVPPMSENEGDEGKSTSVRPTTPPQMEEGSEDGDEGGPIVQPTVPPKKNEWWWGR